jgi:ABC-type multidrug transport system fused ATPase/permease subunit
VPLFAAVPGLLQATQAHVALGRLKDILAAAEVAPVHAEQPTAAAGNTTTTSIIVNTTASDKLESSVSDAVEDSKLQQQQQQQRQKPAICIHGDFSWDPAKPPALTDLNLSIPKGTFVAVVGPTGSGKTSLLAAMLGLLMGVSEDDDTQSQQQQQVQLYGSTAYVPQAPFILGGTVQENILFGRPWDAAKYAAAVAGAQLEHDFSQLPGGDETELGEDGWQE